MIHKRKNWQAGLFFFLIKNICDMRDIVKKMKRQSTDKEEKKKYIWYQKYTKNS